MSDKKQCDTCGEHLPRKDFFKHNWTPDKLRHSCKLCSHERRPVKYRRRSEEEKTRFQEIIQRVHINYDRTHIEPPVATFPVIKRGDVERRIKVRL